MGKYFGTDGIRGRANETLTIRQVYLVGRYIGDYFRKQGRGKIVIGKDTRLSGSMLESALSAGISASGSDVYLLGYCSTPCLAYAAMREDFGCGAMISASHNPFYDNGVKLFGNNGLKIGEDIENLIEAYIDEPEGIPFAVDDAIGKIEDAHELIGEYQNWLKEKYPLDLKGMRLLVDLANGSNCYTAREVLDATGAEVTYINDSPNGVNINTNCGSTHLGMLEEEICKGSYDLGFAFDGDADRVLFVNGKGEEINGDRIMYYLAKYLKEKGRLTNNTLVVTVMSNIGLFKACDNAGISYDITAVGDKNVADSMIRNDFAIGGEQSGHIICRHDSNFGDGLKTALLLLEALKYHDCDIDNAVKDISIYPQLLINVRVKDKGIVLNDEDVKEAIRQASEELGKDGRILVRPSGTEPLIRVMAEAKDDETCAVYVNRIIDVIKTKGYAQA